jgi:hypothetical protein
MFFRFLFVFFSFFCFSSFAQNDRILERAIDALNGGRPQSSIEASLYKILDSYPSSVTAYLTLGSFYLQQEKPLLALFHFYQAHHCQRPHV